MAVQQQQRRPSPSLQELGTHVTTDRVTRVWGDTNHRAIPVDAAADPVTD